MIRRSPLAALALAAALIGAGGCYRAVALAPSELARLTEIDGDALRVYPSRKIIAVHEDVDDPDAIDVSGRKVRQVRDRAAIRDVVATGVAGKIVDRDRQNGQLRLWVAFEPGCRERACAFAFVENTLTPKTYDLVAVPRHEGYDKITVHHGIADKRHRLKKGRVRSLEEPNEVLLRKPRVGKPRRVWLDLRKRTIERRREKVRRLPGVD